MATPFKYIGKSSSLARSIARKYRPASFVAATNVGNLIRESVSARAISVPNTAERAHTSLAPRGSHRTVSTYGISREYYPTWRRPVNSFILSSHQQRLFSAQTVEHHESEDITEKPATPFSAPNNAFNGDYTDVYLTAFQQHGQTHGPWNMMVQAAEEVLHGHIHDTTRTDSDLRILDLASGPGEPALTLAQRFPQATVVSTDASTDMVRAAKDRINWLGLNNVSAQQANIQDLSMFDDASFDLITCCYGLSYAADPLKALEEVHRVLKPGGTFLATVWENVPVDPAADKMMKRVMGKDPAPPRTLNPASLGKPRKLEELVEKSKMSLLHVNHGEYAMQLTNAGDPMELAFKVVSLPIQHDLTELATSGKKPSAFADAMAAFQEVVDEGFMVKTHSDGSLWTAPHRFKMAVVRRGYEDADGKVKRKRTVGEQKAVESTIDAEGKEKLALSTQKVADAFDSVMADVYGRINDGPWKHILKSTKEVLHGHPNIGSVEILDLASGTGEPAASLAKEFPAATVTATDISSKMVEEANRNFEQMGLSNAKAMVADAQELKAFKDGTFDVVTFSFGLTFVPDPESALREIHRVLRPGGTLIVTVWDSIAFEHMSDEIMKDVMEGKGRHPPRLLNHLAFSKPRKLEGLLEGAGMAVMKVDHNEFRIQLSGVEGAPDDFAFNAATIPIHPNLVDLEASGKNKDAFKDARAAFARLVSKRELISFDRKGNMMTSPNRFKVVVARREFEDADGYL